MKHSNISIFVTHVGCPHKCAFCDQHTITGSSELPHYEDVKRICLQALKQVKNPGNTEIAFFGGSFTAIPKEYMLELLQAANIFVGEGKFKGIRVSTRPDYIDDDILSVLKKYHVTSIELGAQSLNDTVLEANERGHTVHDIFLASKLIKTHGFELGLQLMVGLYKSDYDTEIANIQNVLDIMPDTIRIYPVVVLQGTKLARLYEDGEYKLISMNDVIDICSKMLMIFEQSGIKILKCGLHASEFVQNRMVAGFYHPAFKELCETKIMYENMRGELIRKGLTLHESNNIKYFVDFEVSPKCISPSIGHKKTNSDYFKSNGVIIKVTGNKSLPKYKALVKEVRVCT